MNASGRSHSDRLFCVGDARRRKLFGKFSPTTPFKTFCTFYREGVNKVRRSVQKMAYTHKQADGKVLSRMMGAGILIHRFAVPRDRRRRVDVLAKRGQPPLLGEGHYQVPANNAATR